MSIFAKRRAKKELAGLYHEMRQYLANNYKEPAHKSRRALIERTEALYQEGNLSEADYRYWKSVGEEYTRKMADYHH